jgi:hypothetical protein
VQGKYGVVEKGATFGETAILFGSTRSSATIVASRPSPTTGKVVLCRLRDAIFHEMISDDVIKDLQEHITKIRVVIDFLSGV